MQLCFTSEYPDCSFLAPSLFTMRRFLSPRDQAMRHALLSSSETYTLHGSAEPSKAIVLLSTRANSHSTNTRIVQPSLCREQKRDPPCPLTNVLSQLRGSLGYHSALLCFFFDVTPNQTPPPGHGLLTQTPGRQGLCPLLVVLGTCSRPLLLTLEYKNGKVHRGAITYWGNYPSSLCN